MLGSFEQVFDLFARLFLSPADISIINPTTDILVSFISVLSDCYQTVTIGCAEKNGGLSPPTSKMVLGLLVLVLVS